MTPASSFKLLELYKDPAANQLSGFCAYMRKLDLADLVAGYGQMLDAAPRRHARGKRYFVGHTGVPSTGAATNRREEHLALALWNHGRDSGSLSLPSGQALELLDYQLPLKAAQADKGFGKVDLFGAIDRARPCVIELKIHSEGAGQGDTPLRAYLEALAYCAVIEANAADIEREVVDLFGHGFARARPDLMVLSTLEYWRAYARHPRAGDWWPLLGRLASGIEEQLGLRSHFIALGDADFTFGLEGQRPKLLKNCTLLDTKQLLHD